MPPSRYRTVLKCGLLAAALGSVIPLAAAPNPPANLPDFGYDAHRAVRTFDPQYSERMNPLKDEVEAVKKELFEGAHHGKKRPCARERLLEVQWLTHYTARYSEIRQRLDALHALLKQPADPHPSGYQSPEDGSYAPCTQTWFLKLDTTYDHLGLMALEWKKPRYPLRFLDTINSPAKLRKYLDSLRVSDVEKTGEDHRYELNMAVADLHRLITGDTPTPYKFQPGLKQTLLDWEDAWQDPATGFFGEWYRTPEGIKKTADMSCTFHVVSYRHGKVGHWPALVNTVLAMKDGEFPFGWLAEGGRSNHHNLDVAKLLQMGWRYLTPAQQEAARPELRKMQEFCLKETMNPDGSFKMMDSNTVGEAYYFPVALLRELGYFNKKRRFWTTEEFPEAPTVAKKIALKIQALKLDDPESKEALLMVQYPNS